MNAKKILFPAIYSLLVIISTCITFYGGFTDNLNKITIINWLLIVPFCVGAIIYSKKTIYNNVIGGKDLAKEGFIFILISTIILIAFQALFFTIDFKEYKINFMQTYGVELAKAQIKNGNLKIAETEIPKLIAKEIEQVTLFKECTGIVFKNLFLGSMTSVLTAVIIKAKLK